MMERLRAELDAVLSKHHDELMRVPFVRDPAGSEKACFHEVAATHPGQLLVDAADHDAEGQNLRKSAEAGESLSPKPLHVASRDPSLPLVPGCVGSEDSTTGGLVPQAVNVDRRPSLHSGSAAAQAFDTYKKNSLAPGLDRSRSTMIAGSHKSSVGLFEPLSKNKRALLDAQSSTIQKLTRGQAYEIACTVVIVLSMVCLAIEVEHRAWLADELKDEDQILKEQLPWVLPANLINLLFVGDAVLRILADRIDFFTSKEWTWNVIDVLVALVGFVETIVSICQYATSSRSPARVFFRQLSMLRLLRLVRIIRATRSARIIRFIRELRLMIYSLVGTVKSFGWSIVFLLCFLFVSGVFFADGAITYCVQRSKKDSEATTQLRIFFGSLSSAMVSLFKAMSGGEDWGNILDSLEDLSWAYRMFFLVFIAFAVLALLNVITAVFVEAAVQMSQNDRELVVLAEMESKEELISIMQCVFNELDTNDSGALSLDEFERHIDDEKIVAFLNSMGLDVSQVRILFTLLDVDWTGEVDMEEFVTGCLRLKGGAKSLDMAVLIYQVEWIVHHLMKTRCSLHGTKQVGRLSASSPPDSPAQQLYERRSSGSSTT